MPLDIMSYLVIVESPAKASTIKSYLGSNYKVIASKGHIRDLPKSSLGIDIENGFKPHYINIRGKGDVIKELRREAKGATKVFLATDPDREGEAISWHIAIQLGISPDEACRITFNEITKSAVKKAIKNPRPINEDLVNSQQARRILDRIFGFNISELLWKRVKNGLSGGRVQSVATRIITEREEEIRRFVPQEYWTVDVTLCSSNNEEITVKYFGDKKTKLRLSTKAEADAVINALKNESITVSSVRHTVKQKMPSPPFITSTLQQEGSKRLGFQAQKVMMIAQELYDGLNLGAEFGGVQGLITYMRTDSMRIAESAQESALLYIKDNFGEDYLPEKPRVYKSTNPSQDAHEAIRPSNVELTSALVRKYLTPDQYKLYKLIWERFVASQMQYALFDTVTVDVECRGHVFKTGGYMIKSKGYIAVYEDDSVADHTTEDDGESLSKFPELKKGQRLNVKELSGSQHFTEPPARYTEASLIKFLEENGIGRPSTYAPIISIITSRQYVRRDGKSLVSTELGDTITGFMKEYFSDFIDYEFTALMEQRLDSIAQRENTIESVISEFYAKFSMDLEKALESDKIEAKFVPLAVNSEVNCEKCGSVMVYKDGKFGRFLACSAFPACKNTKALDKNGNVVANEEKPAESAGFKCEKCGGDMIVRTGRYGSFYSCSNYPECKFTKQKTYDVGVPCPICNSRIVARQGRGGSFLFNCEAYPECDYSSWDMPLKEKCPECASGLYYKKSRRLVLCKAKGCSYQREEEITVDFK